MKEIDKFLSEKQIFIFDLDGTIIESVSLWNKVDSILRSELLIPPISMEEIAFRRSQSIRRNHGKSNVYLAYCNELAAESPLHIDGTEVYARRRIIAKELPFTIYFKPGVQTFVSKMHFLGKKIILATNTRSSFLELCCRRNKELGTFLTEFFDAIYTLESAERCKPSPEIFNKIAEDFSCHPKECIVFEDSRIGMEAAHSAQMDVVCVQKEITADIPDYVAYCICNYSNLFQ